MAVEFRTSFLGFNRDDVLDYIHKKDADMKILSASLKDKIKSLEEELSSIKTDFSEALKNNAELSEKNEELTAKINEFEAKKDEIESLSRKIGKLYLVSKSSAKSIVDRAEETASIINEQAQIRLKNITESICYLSTFTLSIRSSTN